MTDLREALAAQAHESWSGWMRYLFSKGSFIERSIGHKVTTFELPEWAIKRWQRQMNTPYAELPEEEKESDRKEADEYLLIMEAYTNELVRQSLDSFGARTYEALEAEIVTLTKALDRSIRALELHNPGSAAIDATLNDVRQVLADSLFWEIASRGNKPTDAAQEAS